jgi:hypothetical protein
VTTKDKGRAAGDRATLKQSNETSRHHITVPERATAPYAAIAVAVLDGLPYAALRPASKALLLELCRQHTGTNNGHLHLARGWLARRGWTSTHAITRAKFELVQGGLILETRKGGIGALRQPTLYALAWLPVSNPTGLDFGGMTNDTFSVPKQHLQSAETTLI